MFSIYGISGPLFQGTLENLHQIQPVARSRPVGAVRRISDETSIQTQAARVRQFASKNPCFLPRTPSIYAGFKPIFVNPCNGTFVVYGLNESIT